VRISSGWFHSRAAIWYFFMSVAAYNVRWRSAGSPAQCSDNVDITPIHVYEYINISVEHTTSTAELDKEGGHNLVP